jgi:hypothetical protein
MDSDIVAKFETTRDLSGKAFRAGCSPSPIQRAASR